MNNKFSFSACLFVSMSLLLGACSSDDPSEILEPSTKEAIDLGLSVKWSATNIGAASPDKYGAYFSWAETEPKVDYSWATYKYGNGWDNLTKYNTVDKLLVLEPDDDAAHVRWGGSWRMPTYDEMSELMTKCSWSKAKVNGVDGMLVSAPNGNSIFLPKGGTCAETELKGVGQVGCYWTSSSDPTALGSAMYLILSTKDDIHFGSDRNDGFLIRPVCPN